MKRRGIAAAMISAGVISSGVACGIESEETPKAKCERLLNEGVDKAIKEAERGKSYSARGFIPVCEALPREVKLKILRKLMDERGIEILRAAVEKGLRDMERDMPKTK